LLLLLLFAAKKRVNFYKTMDSSKLAACGTVM